MSLYDRMVYHAQEKRSEPLVKPIWCEDASAWLGRGYYFWEDLRFAEWWGRSQKMRISGQFEIYKAHIRSENILDTVFNREHYEWWVSQVEKVAKVIKDKYGKKATLSQLNEYMMNRANWREKIDGVLFQDLPRNEDFVLVQGLWYKKRIQLVVYNADVILSFTSISEKGKR